MKIKLRDCPFCNQSNLVLNHTEDNAIFWIQCRTKKCMTMGPMCDLCEVPVKNRYKNKIIQKYSPYNSKAWIAHAKEIAIKKWNNDSTKLKTISIKSTLSKDR